jgi:hypothetical protein
MGSVRNSLGIIRRWRDADSFRGSAKHVAHVMDKVLKNVGCILHACRELPASEDLIVDHDIVRRLGCLSVKALCGSVEM